ncbi:hypothetical protein [Propionicicella superfundia]|uniref:hypothetical protein n=1 Tax=Propionicicella superfundia TaxID=348582 RepID=UPI00048C6DEE|nr:hypothetical protein [Propionicicella superfundia]
MTLGALGAFGGFIVPTPAAADGTTTSAKTITAADYYQNAWSTDAERTAAKTGAPFPDLKVTISQTEDLMQQGITLSYSGGTKSTEPQGTVVGGESFLQVAQCWGDEPGSNGTRPDRRTCQYGGTNGGGATRDGYRDTESVDPTHDAQYSADVGGYTYTNTPFVGYNDGLVVDEAKAPDDKVLINTTKNTAGQVVMKTGSDYVQLYNNTFFNANTTNELTWAPFGSDGTGSAPFEVQTAMQAPGLGCGTPITQADGSVKGQSCWLVVIPRGTSDNGANYITTSGLWWDSWEHHIAVKLQFKPLGVRCELGASERQLAGSELIAEAIGSWQPVVCQDASPFVLARIPESDAAAAASGTAPSPLALTSRPLDLERVSVDEDPLAYAPVALGGVTISFAIDAWPASSAKPEYQARRGLPLTSMKLTPRLVAKLLTASYRNAIPAGADASHLGYKSAAEPGKNPLSIVLDKDFQEINDPEWAAQNISGISVSDALEPLGRSDLAQRVWEYVLADKEAREWLNGKADPWGMVVNPCYSTNAKVSATCPKTEDDAPDTAPLVLPRDDFPKADPSFKPEINPDQVGGSGEVNLVTWRPYTSGFTDGAYRVLRGDGMILSGWTPAVTDPKTGSVLTPGKFGTQSRQLLGSRQVIGVSTSPSAQAYQTATALLRNPAGEFVGPTTAGLQAAAAAMTATKEQAQVVSFDQTSATAKAAKDAYPLAMPIYAALNPKQTDAAARADYADLISYAATTGQSPGTDEGKLPAGYAPIPKAWQAQALKAAEAIRKGAWPSDSTPSPATTTSPSKAAPSDTTSGTSSGDATPSPGSQVSDSAGAPSSAAQPATGDNPAAEGTPGGSLRGSDTPDDPGIGALGAAVPATGLVGLAAALGVPAISRFRRSP